MFSESRFGFQGIRMLPIVELSSLSLAIRPHLAHKPLRCRQLRQKIGLQFLSSLLCELRAL